MQKVTPVFLGVVALINCNLWSQSPVSCMLLSPRSHLGFWHPIHPTRACWCHCITQYGSTVYIGIAMVYPHWKPYIRFFITFTFSLLPTELLLTWMCGYTWKLNVIIKWYNLMDDKGVKLTKVHFVNSPSSASSSSSSSSSSAWRSVSHKR